MELVVDVVEDVHVGPRDARGLVLAGDHIARAVPYGDACPREGAPGACCGPDLDVGIGLRRGAPKRAPGNRRGGLPRIAEVWTDDSPVGVGKAVVAVGHMHDMAGAAEVLVERGTVRFIDADMAVVLIATGIDEDVALLGLRPLDALPASGKRIPRIVSTIATWAGDAQILVVADDEGDAFARTDGLSNLAVAPRNGLICRMRRVGKGRLDAGEQRCHRKGKAAQEPQDALLLHDCFSFLKLR